MTDYDLLESLFPFWKQLSEAEKQEFSNGAYLHSYEKGRLVHGGGTNCTGAIGVKSGRLRAYLVSEEGKEISLFRLLPGDACILTASCIMKNISFDVSVSAESNSQLILVNPAVFDKISKQNAAAAEFMTELISTRFSEAMWVMEQVLFMKLDRRLAIFLMEQSAIEGSDTIRLTHQEIADHMGSAREVISRMLKYFSGEGLVIVSRKGISLLDRDRLLSMM